MSADEASFFPTGNGQKIGWSSRSFRKLHTHGTRNYNNRHMDSHNRLAILCGGGPAPGLNGVISAATIRARLDGVEVLGLKDGFEWIMQGDIGHIVPLTIEGLSRIHFQGGSHIGIARANPSKSPALLENAVQSLLRLNVSQLITIGGDDTALCTCRKPSTTISTCRRTSTRSDFRQRATSASSSSRI
jgi:hypothetical protein